MKSSKGCSTKHSFQIAQRHSETAKRKKDRQVIEPDDRRISNLKHTPLVEEKNALGAISGYFMHISPNNDPALLKKIILTRSNFVWFSAKQVSVASKN